MRWNLSQDIADAFIAITQYVRHFRGRGGLLDPSPQRIKLPGSLFAEDVFVERVLQSESLNWGPRYRPRCASDLAIARSSVQFDVNSLIPLMSHSGGKELRVQRYEAVFFLGPSANF